MKMSWNNITEPFIESDKYVHVPDANLQNPFSGPVNVNGETHWYQNGLLHREDGPAIEFPSGIKMWYRNGKGHRDDGPAIEYADGTKEWYRNGKLHREDGPAKEFANGDKYWYKNGVKISFLRRMWEKFTTVANALN